MILQKSLVPAGEGTLPPASQEVRGKTQPLHVSLTWATAVECQGHTNCHHRSSPVNTHYFTKGRDRPGCGCRADHWPRVSLVPLEHSQKAGKIWPRSWALKRNSSNMAAPTEKKATSPASKSR